MELAKAGITHLTLVDNDSLSRENVYRHLLGTNSLLLETYKDNLKVTQSSNPKIFGLKKEIQDRLPHTTIEVSSKCVASIEDIIMINEVDFKQFDLIIVALGNPTIELYLNRYFHEERAMPPVLFTWLETYGIGGHALLTNNNGKNGCLQCLYSNPRDKNAPLYNQTSFAAEGQFFAKTISGCGSVYTPYGSLDSIQTTVLAAKMAINVLSGKEMDSPILSWKGNADTFLESGYRLSERYSLSEERLFNSRYNYKINACKVCGHLREV